MKDKYETLEQQVQRLADYILEEYPDEITGGGAVDVAIKILKKNKS